jgi:2-polyprenyl-3-methyl-5-hydroxy-6-metoxy-1,4-benzoquinol methylase
VRVLLVPGAGRGQGSGHLRRCLRLARLLGEGAAVLLEPGRSGGEGTALELLAPLAGEGPLPAIEESFEPEAVWDLVVLDRRRTSLAEVARFLPLPVLGLDEGGAARRFVPYLVDTPVGFPFGHAPNLRTPALLGLPGRRQGWRFPFEKVLVSFGGEDAVDLSGRLLKALLSRSPLRPEQLTVVQGPYFRRRRWPAGVTVLVNPPQLQRLLAEYDLLVTAFGLTAWEALVAGVPVVLLHPSRYHRRLGRLAGFPDIGLRRPRVRSLTRLLADRGRFEALLAGAPRGSAEPDREANRFFAGLRPMGNPRCPVCGSAVNPAVARFPKRTYLRCLRCRILYLVPFGEAARCYDENYFFQEYRQQYGRSYLEDFEAIKAMGRRRLRIVQKLLPKGAGPPRLLDVGCAYGAFLQAAAELGFATEGLDISPQAVRYVMEHLGIACRVEDFAAPAATGSDSPGYHALSLWYVIEHFRDTAAVLWRANRLLHPGGVLAFSTPNAGGVSARRSLRRFLQASPSDHFTVWNARSTAALLLRFGFRLRRIKITGHHPERFPCGQAFPAGVLRLASRLAGLGDTYEAYAVKIGEPS